MRWKDAFAKPMTSCPFFELLTLIALLYFKEQEWI